MLSKLTFKKLFIIVLVFISVIGFIIGYLISLRFSQEENNALQPSPLPQLQFVPIIKPHKITPVANPYDSSKWKCPSLSQVLQAIDKTIKVRAVSIREKARPPEVLWRTGDTLPFIAISAEDFLSVEIEKGDDTSFDIIFDKLITPELEAFSFTPHEPSSYIASYQFAREGELNTDYKRQFAFLKNSYLYTIVTPSDIAKSSIHLDIQCAKVTREMDQLIQQIYSISNYAEGWDSDTILKIIEKYENLLQISVSSLDYSGSDGEWWVKSGVLWEKVFSGQNDPPCVSFEKRKIGRGMSCVRCEGSDLSPYANPYDESCRLIDSQVVY